MAEEPAQQPFNLDQLITELRARVETQRAAGAYAEDLSEVKLSIPRGAATGTGPRIQFRPELGFSSKPVIGPVISAVKRVILRLQFYVFDDLARQADTAITDVEARLAAEVAMRERLEAEMESKVRELEEKVRVLEGRGGPSDA